MEAGPEVEASCSGPDCPDQDGQQYCRHDENCKQDPQAMRKTLDCANPVGDGLQDQYPSLLQLAQQCIGLIFYFGQGLCLVQRTIVDNIAVPPDSEVVQVVREPAHPGHCR